MTKHRSVVAGYDSAFENPDGSTGRPKGVQTAASMRIATTYDVLAEGVFAAHGTPQITGSPTDTATISPFMAAIEAPTGGFYVVSIDADESLTINLANAGLVKIFVQQRDWEVDNVSEDSEVVLGAVYGATSIPDGALQLFEATIVSQTSTSGLSFNPVFKWTGAASGAIRIPATEDLDRVALVQNGTRALTLDGSGEFVFSTAGDEWLSVSPSNNLASVYPVGSIYMNATNNANPATLLGFGTWAAFGAGRVPVGFDSSQTEFNAAQKTGGAKTHTLTGDQIPSHSHLLVNSTEGYVAASSGESPTGYFLQTTNTAGGKRRISTQSDGGGGQSHNNLQPYITVYMWRRTA